MARKVTSVGRRIGAATSGRGKVHHERVEAEGRVNVKITEQHLLRGRCADRGQRLGLFGGVARDGHFGTRHRSDVSGNFVVPQPAAAHRLDEHRNEESRGQARGQYPLGHGPPPTRVRSATDVVIQSPSTDLPVHPTHLEAISEQPASRQSLNCTVWTV